MIFHRWFQVSFLMKAIHYLLVDMQAPWHINWSMHSTMYQSTIVNLTYRALHCVNWDFTDYHHGNGKQNNHYLFISPYSINHCSHSPFIHSSSRVNLTSQFIHHSGWLKGAVCNCSSWPRYTPLKWLLLGSSKTKEVVDGKLVYCSLKTEQVEQCLHASALPWVCVWWWLV